MASSNLLFNLNRKSRFPNTTSNENNDRTDKFFQSKDAESKLIRTRRDMRDCMI